jgi:hypothetical protein
MKALSIVRTLLLVKRTASNHNDKSSTRFFPFFVCFWGLCAFFDSTLLLASPV